MHFLSGKMKSMLQSDQFDTLCLTYVAVVVIDFRCECFLPNPFFYPRKKRKEVENEGKNIDAYKKR